MKDAGSVSGERRKKYVLTKKREYWSDEEHRLFVDAVAKFGRDWKRVEQIIGTKTSIQVRSHAQKHFIRLAKERERANARAQAARSHRSPQYPPQAHPTHCTHSFLPSAPQSIPVVARDTRTHFLSAIPQAPLCAMTAPLPLCRTYCCSPPGFQMPPPPQHCAVIHQAHTQPHYPPSMYCTYSSQPLPPAPPYPAVAVYQHKREQKVVLDVSASPLERIPRPASPTSVQKQIKPQQLYGGDANLALLVRASVEMQAAYPTSSSEITESDSDGSSPSTPPKIQATSER